MCFASLPSMLLHMGSSLKSLLKSKSDLLKLGLCYKKFTIPLLWDVEACALATWDVLPTMSLRKQHVSSWTHLTRTWPHTAEAPTTVSTCIFSINMSLMQCTLFFSPFEYITYIINSQWYHTVWHINFVTLTRIRLNELYTWYTQWLL